VWRGSNESEGESESKQSLHFKRESDVDRTYEKKTPFDFVMARAILTSVVVIMTTFSTVYGGNPFTKDVVELTSSNWKTVIDSPQGWFINFCREG